MTNATTTSSLEKAFAGVADNYRGSDVDLNAVYAAMRRDSPVMEGNFMAGLGVPNIAGLDAKRPTFTVFKYRDVMAVLRDATHFCPRRSKFEPPCRLNIEPGVEADFERVGCG